MSAAWVDVDPLTLEPGMPVRITWQWGAVAEGIAQHPWFSEHPHLAVCLPTDHIKDGFVFLWRWPSRTELESGVARVQTSADPKWEPTWEHAEEMEAG